MEIITDENGVGRVLGYKPPDKEKQKLRASRTNIQTYRTNAGLPALVPQAEWEELDYVTDYPLELILDQGQLGACTAFSDIGAGARQRYIRTGEILIPSSYFVYDQINGGADNGSNIIDSMFTIEQTGAPPLASYPKCIFKAGRLPTNVPYYKEDIAITLTSAVECVTALLMGMFPQVPIYVTDSPYPFEKFTTDGVAWNGVAPKNRASNHSVYLAGIKKIASGWVFIMVNSWRSTWGPFRNGTCLIPFAAVDNPSTLDDAYAHGSTPVPNGSGIPVGAASA